MGVGFRLVIFSLFSRIYIIIGLLMPRKLYFPFSSLDMDTRFLFSAKDKKSCPENICSGSPVAIQAELKTTQKINI